MTTATVFRRQIVSRTAAALLGGYVFAWGFIALGVAGMFAAGMSFHDAEHLFSMLALLLYLVVFLWSFAARGMRVVWLVLVGGGALMTALASVIQHSMV